MFVNPPTQLSYRRQRHREVVALTTANSTAELALPEEEEDYIIRIQTLSEGGLGPASEPVRVHRLSKTTPGCHGYGGFTSVNNLQVGKKKKTNSRSILRVTCWDQLTAVCFRKLRRLALLKHDRDILSSY